MSDQSQNIETTEFTMKPRRFFMFLPFIFILFNLDTPFVVSSKTHFVLENLIIFAVLEFILYLTIGRAFVSVYGTSLTSRYMTTQSVDLTQLSQIKTTPNGALRLQDNSSNKVTLYLQIYSKSDGVALFSNLQPYLTPNIVTESWRLRKLLKMYGSTIQSS